MYSCNTIKDAPTIELKNLHPQLHSCIHRGITIIAICTYKILSASRPPNPTLFVTKWYTCC